MRQFKRAREPRRTSAVVLTAASIAASAAVLAGTMAAMPARGADEQQQPSQTAQQPATGSQADQAGRGRGRGGGAAGPRIALLPFEDRTGFESIFNGTRLNPGEQQQQAAIAAAQAAAKEGAAKQQAAGQPPAEGRGRGGRGGGGGGQISRFQDWDGDPKFWRVENGVIVGESTPEKVVGPNTFLIWRGATPGDFELKVEIRMNSTNSGIQYRSRMIPANQGRAPDQPGHAWRLGGYQMDMDFNNNFPGGLYEEGGRGFLAERGTMTYIAPDGTKSVVGQLRSLEELKASFKPGEWNQFHILARGNTLVHVVNGFVTAVCVDDDVKGRALGGLIGFQLHGGPPMKLELRNVAIKLK